MAASSARAGISMLTSPVPSASGRPLKMSLASDAQLSSGAGVARRRRAEPEQPAALPQGPRHKARSNGSLSIRSLPSEACRTKPPRSDHGSLLSVPGAETRRHDAPPGVTILFPFELRMGLVALRHCSRRTAPTASTRFRGALRRGGDGVAALDRSTHVLAERRRYLRSSLRAAGQGAIGPWPGTTRRPGMAAS